VVPKPVDRSALLARLARLGLAAMPEVLPRVLIVDDDPAVLEVLTSVLAPAGYAVTSTRGPREALDLARRDRPELLIADLMMPEMSGFELLETLDADESTRGIPTLVLTAADLTEDEHLRLRRHAQLVARKGNVGREELVAAIERAIGRRSAPPDPGRATLLVVDDHDLNRVLACSILEAAGHRVLTAERADEGLALAIQEKPALALLDLSMPGKDGYTLARELKSVSSTASIRLVALTALAMRGDEEKALAAGFDAYLTKPLDRRALMETVGRLLHGAA
jgi:CheY-like chemotaxis protein